MIVHSAKKLVLGVALCVLPLTAAAEERGISYDYTRNIFLPIGKYPTKAAKYFTKLKNPRGFHEVYELNMCPGGRSSCSDSEKLVNQHYWKAAYLHWGIGSTITPDNRLGFPAFNEPAVEKYYNAPRQCVAFAKRMAWSTKTTRSWKRGRHVSEGAGDRKALGKVVAFFNRQYTYPSGSNGSYGHVGVLLDYVYDSQGRAVGFWLLDQNLFGNPRNDGKIRKHLLMFNNRQSGVRNGSNYHFVDFQK